MRLFSDIKSRIKQVGPVYRTINRLKGTRLHEPVSGVARVSVLGSDYGGWGVDLARVSTDSIVYCFGVGEDASFDLALIEQAGCTVDAFDPTPIAVEWVAAQNFASAFRFHPVGIAAADGEVEFNIPPIAGWHSYSMTAEPGAAQTGTIRCPVRRLASLLAERGHDRIDLLKMDIEGFEYPVIDDIIASGIRPEQMLIEFHHGIYGISSDQTRKAVAALQDYGYAIAWLSDLGREYNFVKVVN